MKMAYITKNFYRCYTLLWGFSVLFGGVNSYREINFGHCILRILCERLARTLIFPIWFLSKSFLKKYFLSESIISTKHDKQGCRGPRKIKWWCNVSKWGMRGVVPLPQSILMYDKSRPLDDFFRPWPRSIPSISTRRMIIRRLNRWLSNSILEKCMIWAHIPWSVFDLLKNPPIILFVHKSDKSNRSGPEVYFDDE